MTAAIAYISTTAHATRWCSSSKSMMPIWCFASRRATERASLRVRFASAGGEVRTRVPAENHLGHVGDLLLDQVEFAERAAELPARRRALHGQLHRALRASDATRAERAPAVVEDTQRDLQPLAHFAE